MLDDSNIGTGIYAAVYLHSHRDTEFMYTNIRTEVLRNQIITFYHILHVLYP